jgi:hypothetical protein
MEQPAVRLTSLAKRAHVPQVILVDMDHLCIPKIPSGVEIVR